MHVLADCRWMPKDVLSQKWRRITQDSFIVDIRRIKGWGSPRARYKVFRELLKYPTKIPEVPPDVLGKMAHAFFGRRMIQPFGGLSAGEDEGFAPACPVCGGHWFKYIGQLSWPEVWDERISGRQVKGGFGFEDSS